MRYYQRFTFTTFCDVMSLGQEYSEGRTYYTLYCAVYTIRQCMYTVQGDHCPILKTLLNGKGNDRRARILQRK